MKNFLFLSTWLAAPLALLVPGCSGGNIPANPFTNPTPKPVATPAPDLVQTSTVTLGNKQRALIKTARDGAKLTGTIQISTPVTTATSEARLTTPLKIGTFQLSGTFTAPRQFNLSATDGGTTIFTLNGQFPTATEDGSYSLRIPSGAVDRGILPKSGAPTPNITPVPTGTTPPSNIPNGINLTFTASNPATFPLVPLRNTQFLVDKSTGSLNMTLTNDTSDANARFIQAILAKPAAGKTYNFPATPVSGFIGTFTISTATTMFSVTRGQVTINSLTSNSAALTFKDVLCTSETGETVRVNGTVSNPFTAQ